MNMPKTDKEGLLNWLIMVAGHVQAGRRQEALFMLSDIADTLSADRVTFSYGGGTPEENEEMMRQGVAAYCQDNPAMVD